MAEIVILKREHPQSLREPGAHGLFMAVVKEAHKNACGVGTNLEPGDRRQAQEFIAYLRGELDD
jgi:hypothetical protein